jgi:serine/threonine protein kinase/Flp pilus assembly protein TadD
MSETESTMPAPDEYNKSLSWESPDSGRTQIEHSTIVTDLGYRLLQTGETIGGRYKIIGKLGSGGFAMTYLAKDLQDAKKSLCVVKHLQPRFNSPAACDSARQRFQREAAVLKRLGSHSQIPRLIAYFEERREFYLVQEFVPGEELKKNIAHGVWTEVRVIAFLIDVLHILDFVHSQAAIHRDIKPSNLLCRQEDGKVVLIDFGAVKEVGTLSDGGAIHTLQTQIIGTPGYMSPEQTHGKPTYSSDIYGLGRTAIFALTGRSPLDLEETGTEEITCWQDLTQVSPKLAATIDKMIRPKPSERYRSAKEVLIDLQPLHRLGSIVGNRYQIVGYLGGKENRHAYLAEILSEDSETNLFFAEPFKNSPPNLCVIKIVEPQITDPRSRQQAESWLERQLDKWSNSLVSTHIPQIITYFWQEDRFYWVEEYLEGKNLAEEITEKQPWHQDETIALLASVIPTLDLIHKKGFVHQDIKPSNIIRQKTGGFAVIDGGIISHLENWHPAVGEADGFVPAIGTVGYMPSEQIAGNPHPTSDLYALGKVALQFLSKVDVNESRVDDSLTASRQKMGTIVAELLEKGRIERKFAQVLQKMTEGERQKRYSSTDRLLRDLRACKRKSFGKLKSWHYLVLGFLLATGIAYFGRYYWMQYQALLLFDQGEARLELGQDRVALDYYQQGMEKFSGKVIERVWIGKATALSRLKRYSEMRQTCEEILAVNQDSIYAWNCVGLAYMGLEKYKEAIAAFNEAYNRDTSFFDAVNNRGFAYFKLGNKRQAENDLRMAIRLDPQQSYVPLNNLAQLYFQEGKYAEALGHYQKAIELKKDYLPAWVGLGNSQRQLGYPEQALATFERALALDARSAEVWYFKALAEKDLGKNNEAKLSLEKSLFFSPDYKAAKDALQRVESIGE